MPRAAWFLITSGDPEQGEPEFLCAVQGDALPASLKRCAEQIVDEGGNVTALRVWALTGVEVATKAFEVRGLDKVGAQTKA